MQEKTMEIFPASTTVENPIPESIWPDLAGVQDAKVKEYGVTLADWTKFWTLAQKQKVVSIDTETSGLRPFHGDHIIGVAGAFFDGKTIHAGYWNMRHVGHPAHCKAPPKWDKDNPTTPWPPKGHKHGPKCIELCKGYIETAPVIPVKELNAISVIHENNLVAGQNYKFDIKMFYIDGVSIPKRVLDTMLIAHLFDENKRTYSLDSLGKEMGELKLGDSIKEYRDAHGLTFDGHGHEQIPFELERPYAMMDTILVLKRLQYERERWVRLHDNRIMEVFQLENACSPVVAQMEINGIQLDMPFIKKCVEVLTNDVEVAKQAIYKLAGKEFDIASHPQLWEILEAKGFKPFSLTNKGQPSLDDAALLSYNDPLCALVKVWRGKSKTLGTYFGPFLNTHADPDGRLHSEFFIHGTVSGRMSCREPNLQNITRFEKFSTQTKTGSVAKAVQNGLKFEDMITENAIETRRAFVPRAIDTSMFFFDYAQMELRLFAEVAEEEFLLKALEDGEDMHEATARSVFPNFPSKEQNPKLFGYFRQLAKQINFGIIYGMGRNKLAQQLSVPVDETVRAIEIAKEMYAVMPKNAKDYCTFTLEELNEAAESHRVMTAARQWHGLRSLGKTLIAGINVPELEKLLVSDDKNIRLMYSAEQFLAKYHARFPKIKQLVKKIDSTLGSRGFIFNRYGRRYHLPKDQSYVGVNRWVQGTCSDMVKVAGWRVQNLLKGYKSKLINQVHDEFQLEINHLELHLVPLIKDCLQYFPNIKVKMSADADYSHIAWSEKRGWKGIQEFLDADTRKRTPEMLKALKLTYGWIPTKKVKEAKK